MHTSMYVERGGRGRILVNVYKLNNYWGCLSGKCSKLSHVMQNQISSGFRFSISTTTNGLSTIPSVHLAVTD